METQFQSELAKQRELMDKWNIERGKKERAAYIKHCEQRAYWDNIKKQNRCKV